MKFYETGFGKITKEQVIVLLDAISTEAERKESDIICRQLLQKFLLGWIGEYPDFILCRLSVDVY